MIGREPSDDPSTVMDGSGVIGERGVTLELERPTLSVLTPSFNYATYIGDCIDSVLRQAPSFAVQHVIVDDGSTDDSWDVIRSHHPTWERDCLRQTNRGLAATFNEALALSTGEWLLWLNADDFLLPDSLRLARRAMSMWPSVDIIFGDTIFMDESARFMRLVAQPRFDRRIFEGGYTAFHTPSVLFRRRLLPPGQGLDESMRLLMDLDLWLTITAANVAVAKVDAPLSAFRRHARQISATNRDTDVDEQRRIAQRHELPHLVRSIADSPHARSMRRARLLHGWLKVVEGAWWREWKMRAYRGRAIDWMNGNTLPRQPVDEVRITLRRRSSVGS